MTLEVDLYEGVKAQAAIANTLGGGEAPRWYFGMAPQELPRTYPYATAVLRYPRSTHHMLGVSAIEEPTLEVDIWAQDPAQAMAVGRLLDAWLDPLRGVTLGGTKIRGVFRQLLDPQPMLRGAGSELQIFRVRGEWRIVYAS